MFALRQNHKYDILWVETLYPFERDFYLSMLSEWVKEEEELARQSH